MSKTPKGDARAERASLATKLQEVHPLTIKGDEVHLNVERGLRDFGTDDIDVVIGLLDQISKTSQGQTEATETEFAFITGFVRDLKPRDSAELMLITQMAYTHKMFMKAADRVASTLSMDVYLLVEKATARLARTFAQQMTALKIYRLQSAKERSAALDVTTSPSQSDATTVAATGEIVPSQLVH